MPDNPITDLTRGIEHDVKSFGYEFPERFKTIILAGITLGATLQCNVWLAAVLEKLLGPANSTWAKFIHLCLWVVVLAIATVKFRPKDHVAPKPAAENKGDDKQAVSEKERKG